MLRGWEQGFYSARGFTHGARHTRWCMCTSLQRDQPPTTEQLIKRERHGLYRWDEGDDLRDVHLPIVLRTRRHHQDAIRGRDTARQPAAPAQRSRSVPTGRAGAVTAPATDEDMTRRLLGMDRDRAWVPLWLLVRASICQAICICLFGAVALCVCV